MYSIRDLENTFNWSYDQIRDRIVTLGDEIDEITERGKNNKIFITEKGLSLLKKLKELEAQGKSVQNSIETIIKDLEDDHRERRTEVPKSDKADSYPEQVELLKDQVKELKEDKRYLRQKLDKKEEKIQQLLPGKVEQEKPEASPWKLFKNWLFKPQ